MSFRRQIRRPTPKRGGLLPVLLAVLALLTQVMMPAVVAAQTSGGTRTVVLCTVEGEKIVAVPTKAPKPFAGFKCHDCVIAAVTAVVPPSVDSRPVRYAAIVRQERAQAWRAQEPARPPPRPPSQGPPTAFDL